MTHLPRPLRAALVSLAAVGLLGVAACAQPADGDAGGPSTPVSGGSVTVGTNGQEFDCIAPPLNASLNGTLAGRAFTDSPLFQDPDDGSIQPWLVTDWDISDDGLTYTFDLLDGVTFHDGAAWNAEAFKANLDWIVEPETLSPMVASYLASYESSRVVDELTLEVTLASPYSALLSILSQGYLGVISPTQIAEDPESICTEPIGSGPFELTEWVKGQRIDFAKNEDYAWGAPGSHDGPAYLDEYSVVFLGEDATRLNALTSGQVDVIDWVPAQNVEQLEGDPGYEVTSLTTPGQPYSWQLNTSRPPFDDQRVRQALLAGIDRDQIVQSVLFGQYETATGFLSASTVGASPAPIEFDPDRANDLLDEAGWDERDAEGYRVKDGERLTAVFPTTNAIATRVQIAEQIQAQARDALGVEIDIEFPAAADLTQRGRDGDYDVNAGIWGTNAADILWQRYHSDGITDGERIGLNVARLDDAEVDRIVQAARETTDGDEQAALYAEAQERLTELAAALPLYDDRRIVASNAERVHGLRLDVAYPAILPHDIWTEAAG